MAESLAAWLDRLTFADLTTDETTERIIGAVVEWGRAQPWRVYRRAASVLPLPPPLHRRQSVLDVAFARADAPPVVVEVDHTDRRRTVDKLLAEAGAGRVAIWLRWGTGRFASPPAPVRMVTCAVTRRRGPADREALHSRLPATERPAPPHSAVADAGATAVPLIDPGPP